MNQEDYLGKTYVKKEILNRDKSRFGFLLTPVEKFYFTLELNRSKNRVIARTSDGKGHNKYSHKEVVNKIKKGKWVEV